MENNKIYLLSLAIFGLLMGFLITYWDSSQPLANEIGWVLKELPEVKSLEYLETLKKI